MDLHEEFRLAMTRRHFFSLGTTGIGTAALASLLRKWDYPCVFLLSTQRLLTMMSPN